jgi:hypothetical protein
MGETGVRIVYRLIGLNWFQFGHWTELPPGVITHPAGIEETLQTAVPVATGVRTVYKFTGLNWFQFGH